MAVYLNTRKSFENFKELSSYEYFVDKSNIISLINKKISTSDKYICITRPRRFGKSSVADMLGAYYTKAVNSREIFDKLEVSESESYEANLNKYNVISISFNKIPEDDINFNNYMNMIKTSLINDIKNAYPKIKDNSYFTISDMLMEKNIKIM